MPGRLAIDFGTSNTVVAVWDEATRQGTTLHLPGVGRMATGGEARGSWVPSLIHYAADRRRWVGDQVSARQLRDDERTFFWMKRYVAARSPRKRRLDGREISEFDAARDFLSSVLLLAAEEAGGLDEEVAFTVPVEAYEHYEDWLAGVAEQVGVTRYRLIDEPSAAALGYGAHIQPGDVYLIVDFGGGTLDVSIVLIEEEAQAAGGRRCRVLGKAGAEVGGADLDQWLYQEVLRRRKLDEADPALQRLGRQLLGECERAKERLSFVERAEITVLDPDTGMVLAETITRAQLETLLDSHDMLAQLDRTLRRALNDARDRGYREEDIKAVLMVGGGSQIPVVQSTLQRIFGRDRVMLDRPMDAVARGAAAFVAGVDFYDHVQHDYALRFRDRAAGGYAYRLLVPKGTPYPTAKPIAFETIKAAVEGQTQLALAIFELGESRRAVRGAELVFDPSGGVRLLERTPDDEAARSRYWMNEQSPTFLVADPPARHGEPCFDVEFSIDGHKRLLITARDARTGRVTHQDFPVVKLT